MKDIEAVLPPEPGKEMRKIVNQLKGEAIRDNDVRRIRGQLDSWKRRHKLEKLSFSVSTDRGKVYITPTTLIDSYTLKGLLDAAK